jgi:hypothetical protein
MHDDIDQADSLWLFKLPEPPDGSPKYSVYHWKLLKALAEYRHTIHTALRFPARPFADDWVARDLLEASLALLPDSERMRKAARAGLAESGRDEIDDESALAELAYLVVKGRKLRPASREAARLALNEAAVSEESVAHRLRMKFRKGKEWRLSLAQQRLDSERRVQKATRAGTKLRRNKYRDLKPSM